MSALEFLQSHIEGFRNFYRVHPIVLVSAFFAVEVAFYALAIPGAWMVMLGAGAIMGRPLGCGVMALGSTVGSLIVFLSGRTFFRSRIETQLRGGRFHQGFERLRSGFERHGNLYLLSLRLIPFFPHILINFGVSLTRIGVRDFIAFTFLGGLPVIWAFVNAGKVMGDVHSARDVLTVRMLGAMVFLALLPLSGLLVKPFLSRRL